MKSVFMILIALRERELRRGRDRERKQEHERDHEPERTRELLLNPTNVKPIHDLPDLHHIVIKSEFRNQGERKDQGVAAERLPTPPPKHTSVGDRLGEDARYALRTKGECWRPGDLLSIHVNQSRREPGGTRRLGLPPFPLTL